MSEDNQVKEEQAGSINFEYSYGPSVHKQDFRNWIRNLDGFKTFILYL